MGKKRGKDKSSREEDDIDLTGPSCRHIKKGTDQTLLKKLSVASSLNDPSCLFYQGCGRNSENKHAIKHYETPRSDPHCLVISLDNWSVWCYICDDEVQYSRTGHLAQLVTNLKKQTSTDLIKTAPKGRYILKFNSEEKRGVSVKGLSNLGNTCFFNAVIQNLSQTQLLRQTLNKVTEEKMSLNIKPDDSLELQPIAVQLEQPGSLTLAMCQLLSEIRESKKSVVTPRDLFTQVCKKAARFKGFQQQDSQELLRYLLDGMRTEELKRLSSGIMEALKQSRKGTEGDQLKALVKEYEKNGIVKNFVDQVFGGETTSTIMCQQCKMVSVVTERFLDLSLPVSDESMFFPCLDLQHQKRQQKLEGRVTLDSLTSPSHTESEETEAAVDPKENENADNGTQEEQNPARKVTLDDAFIEDSDGMEQSVVSEEEGQEAKEYTVLDQDPELAFSTLAMRTPPEKQDCSVQSCLFQFTEVETLTQNNSLLCVTCTKQQLKKDEAGGSKKNIYTDALKQMLISSPPPVLTLHLKRFQQNGYSICKVNRHVNFPLILDLAPFCAVKCKVNGDTQILYSLYGIVEHSGTMRSGHYTAYVKVRPECPKPSSNGVAAGDAEPPRGSWFHISDTSVQPVSESKVQSCQAYLLFYERIL
uniref:Ubiquitin carboxyl-terminal hydrolase n=1 Tax=Amphiprion ocellaris TaxID=80972 RepID=A0AAQ5YI58_AMPOC